MTLDLRNSHVDYSAGTVLVMLRIAAQLAAPCGHIVRCVPLATRRWVPTRSCSCTWSVVGVRRWQHNAIPPTATIRTLDAVSSNVGDEGEHSVEGPPLVSARTPKMRSRKFTMQSFYNLLPALEQGEVRVSMIVKRVR